jgi:CP family cyanate transporter-like MFS transporter
MIRSSYDLRMSVTATDEPTRVGTTALPLIRGRMLVFAAIVLSAFTLRAAVTSVSPLFGRIGDDLNFGPNVVGVLGMIPTAMFALFGVCTPFIAGRWGLERTVTVAMILTTVGMAARAFAPEVVSLILLSAVALAGMGISNVVVPPLVKRYFPDRVAAMSTVYICVLQVSTMAPALLAVPSADAVGWRLSLASWSVIGLAAVLPWTAIAWNARRSAIESVVGQQDPDAQRVPPVQVWRSSLAWGMVVMFAMTSMITYSMLTWLPTLVVESGGGEGFAGASVAVFGVTGLASSLVAPWLCQRLRNPFPVVIACAVCYLAGFAGLFWSPGSATLVWVVLVALGPTTFPMSLTLINLRTRTAAGSAALSGFTQGLGYTIACAGPLLFGLLHSSSGQWGHSLGFLAASVLVLLVGSYFACAPRMLEDTIGRTVRPHGR